MIVLNQPIRSQQVRPAEKQPNVAVELSGEAEHAHGSGPEDAAHAAQAHATEHGHSHGAELHTYIGVSLVLGFIFMLLVDQLSGGGHVHNSTNGEFLRT